MIWKTYACEGAAAEVAHLRQLTAEVVVDSIDSFFAEVLGDVPAELLGAIVVFAKGLHGRALSA